MRLSVIIPTHDVAPWLGQCLASVLGQRVRDLEVWCVDDGSADGTQAILTRQARRDGRLRLLFQRNARQGVARNRGLDRARGEYVAFVDGDDWVDARIWERLLAKARADRCDMVLCEGVRVDDATGRRTRHEYESLPLPRRFFRDAFTWRDWAARANPFGSCVCPPLRLCRRGFVGAHRFPAGMLYEDAPFHFALFFRAARLGAVRGPLYCYRRRAGSTMGVRDARVLDHLRVLDLVWADLGRLGLRGELAAAYAAYAAHLLWKAFTLWPTREAFARCSRWLAGHGPLPALPPEGRAQIAAFRTGDFDQALAAARRLAATDAGRLGPLLARLRGAFLRAVPCGSCLKQALPYGLMTRWLRLRYGVDMVVGAARPLGRLTAFLPYGLVARKRVERPRSTRGAWFAALLRRLPRPRRR